MARPRFNSHGVVEGKQMAKGEKVARMVPAVENGCGWRVGCLCHLGMSWGSVQNLATAYAFQDKGLAECP